jgi:colanic acid biosynthesis glycosyl transferase WcaI
MPHHKAGYPGESANCVSLYNLAVRILVLNLYYPPDTSATAKMAEGVVQVLSAKHQVTVVCGRPSYDPSTRRPWRMWQTERTGDVTTIRVGSTDYPRQRMGLRLLNYLSYVALSVPRALFLRCEVVLAMTDPPFEGIVGALIAMVKRKPYVYNIRDLYPDMATGGRLIRPGPLARLWELIHRWALGRARCVVVLGEDMRNRIIGKGIEGNRVRVIRDGVDLGLSPSQAIDAQVVAEIRNGFRFVLVHAGNLGFYGDWDTLLEAARGFAAEDPGIGLVFVGNGAQRRRLQAKAANLQNVRFLPFYPAKKVPSVLAAADAHVITVRQELEGVVVPSKLYAILAAGKPILGLASERSDVHRIVTDADCGYIDSPLDGVEDFIRVTCELARDTERLHRMGEAARRAAEQYDRVNELRKFLEIVEEGRGA